MEIRFYSATDQSIHFATKEGFDTLTQALSWLTRIYEGIIRLSPIDLGGDPIYHVGTLGATAIITKPE